MGQHPKRSPRIYDRTGETTKYRHCRGSIPATFDAFELKPQGGEKHIAQTRLVITPYILEHLEAYIRGVLGEVLKFNHISDFSFFVCRADSIEGIRYGDLLTLSTTTFKDEASTYMIDRLNYELSSRRVIPSTVLVLVVQRNKPEHDAHITEPILRNANTMVNAEIEYQRIEDEKKQPKSIEDEKKPPKRKRRLFGFIGRLFERKAKQPKAVGRYTK